MTGEWTLRVIGAAILSASVTALVPEGGSKRAVRLVCGLVTASAILGIFGAFCIEAPELSYRKYAEEAERLAASARQNAEKEKSAVIEEKTEAYIMDEAAILGIRDIAVNVTADGGVPVSVEIITAEKGSSCEELAGYIDGVLGISGEKQEWRSSDENT